MIVFPSTLFDGSCNTDSKLYNYITRHLYDLCEKNRPIFLVLFVNEVKPSVVFSYLACLATINKTVLCIQCRFKVYRTTDVLPIDSSTINWEVGRAVLHGNGWATWKLHLIDLFDLNFAFTKGTWVVYLIQKQLNTKNYIKYIIWNITIPFNSYIMQS